MQLQPIQFFLSQLVMQVRVLSMREQTIYVVIPLALSKKEKGFSK